MEVHTDSRPGGPQKLRGAAGRLARWLFSPPQADPLSRGLTALFLAGLFLVGVAHWAFFFDFGRMSFKAYDWPKEFAYYSILREAILGHAIPYHVSQVLFVHQTNRFLSIPETVLSPQILLLKWLLPGKFVMVNAMILQTVGFLGCLAIRARYRLSPFAFTALFLLLSFNGHTPAHLAAGHSMWLGYFFLPLFALVVLKWMEGDGSRATPIQLAFLMLLMALQGSVHLVVWCVLFLLLLAGFHRQYARQALLAVAGGVLLTAFRFVPALITFSHWDRRFIGGFPTIQDFVNGLVTIRPPTAMTLGGILGDLNWWECDFYVGVLGAALIGSFALYTRFRGGKDRGRLAYRALDLPMAVMTVLSMSYFFLPITMMHVPMLNSERVPSRFFIVPLVFLILIACIRLQAWLSHLESRPALRIPALLALAQMAFALMLHSQAWKMARVEMPFRGQDIALSAPAIIQEHDPLYKLLVAGSAAFSGAVALVLLGALAYYALAGRQRKR